jgi:hypothetical protein
MCFVSWIKESAFRETEYIEVLVMKKARKIVVGILVCAALVLVVLRITGLDPIGLRPGLWLKGDVVTGPVADWSFVEKFPSIAIQTHTWYLLPHSVRVGSTCYNGHLYVSSIYMRPGFKYRWNTDLVRDPRVRIKIGNQVFDRTATLVTDPAEKAAVLQTKREQYWDMEPLLHNLPLDTPANVFRISDD